jgi:hypothetical protein
MQCTELQKDLAARIKTSDSFWTVGENLELLALAVTAYLVL